MDCNTSPATTGAAGYTLDASHTGTNAGNGNYLPVKGANNLVGLVPAGGSVLPYDILGNPINNTGTGAAGAVQLLSSITGAAILTLFL
jgi:hypothetical protein